MTSRRVAVGVVLVAVLVLTIRIFASAEFTPGIAQTTPSTIRVRPSERAPTTPVGSVVASPGTRLVVHVVRHGVPTSARVEVFRSGPFDLLAALPSWEPVASSEGTEPSIPVPAGRLLVVATTDGVGRATKAVSVGEAETVDLALELAPGNRTQGIVVQGDGREPITNAELSLIPVPIGPTREAAGDADSFTWHSTSRSDGTFSFEDVPPGLYTLEATAPGHTPARVEHVAVPGPRTTVSLSAASWVEGRVVMVDGSAAPGAAVRASGRLGSTESSATGSFSLEVNPGTFFVTASLGALSARTNARISVVAGQTTKDVVLTLRNGATFTGHVFDALTDAGISGASVSLNESPGEAWPARGALLATALTDGEGAYVIQGVPPGAWNATASRQGRQQFATGLVSMSDERHVQDFNLRSLVDITGWTIRPDGGAFPDAVVALSIDYDRFPADLPHTRSAADGSFVLRDMSPGVLCLGAWARGSSTFTSQCTSGDHAVTLVVDDAVGTVRGRLTPARAGIVVRGRDGSRWVAAFTDATGDFAVTLSPGSWQFSTSNPDSPEKTVTVKAGETTEVELSLEHMVLIRVLDANGAPARGAWLSFSADTSGMKHGAHCDEQGVALVTDAELEGVSRITADCQRFLTGEAPLPPGANELTVRCAPAATLTGEVRRAGPAINGFKVELHTNWFPPALHFEGSSFAIDEALTGKVWVGVTTDDGWSSLTQMTLSPGQAAQTIITVEPPAQRQ